MVNGLIEYQGHYIITSEFIFRNIGRLVQQVSDSDKSYDCIVALSRGGLVLGTYMSYSLSLPLLVLDPKEELSYKYLLDTISSKKFLKVLIVDEINDSGATISDSTTRIKSEFVSPELDIDTCTLFTRTSSIHASTYNTSIIMSTNWLVFPWDANHTELLSKARIENAVTAEAYYVVSSDDKPERIFFNARDAVTNAPAYIDAFNAIGQPTARYKLCNGSYTTDF